MPRFSGGVVFAVVAVALLGSQMVPAATVAYDIVYVRAPRPGGDARESRMADVFRPIWVEPGSDLMLLHPDGGEEVLVAAGENGAVADPCVSFDAQWVYYSFFPDAKTTTDSFQFAVAKGSDIYKVNVKTRQIVRLTHQEYTPNTSVRTAPLPYGIYNMGPCPISGGKVVFTSNRNGFIPTKGFTSVASQLYVMDEDGSNVHAIAPMTLGAALHPFQLKDGRVAFSSFESQGLRDERNWALWAIWPDGRAWEPLMSSFSLASALHFATQLSGGDVVLEDYYNLNNNGFGTFYRFPTTRPASGGRFYPARLADNPALAFSYRSSRVSVRLGFSPVGIQSITPFTHPWDDTAPIAPDGSYAGKVTQPSGAPNGDLLLVWTPGPANGRSASVPAYDAGLYLARNGGPVESHKDLVLIKNDPRYNEQWPRAVVPYSAIYGVAEPHQFPFLPNDGTVHPELPAGTPYGIIGTSSLYKRESFPGKVIAGLNYDGLEAFNSTVAESINWFTQGSDAGKYSNEEIAAIRILAMEPTTNGVRKWFNHANERLRTLGEIPVRKSNADGSPVLDSEGNPDTSFWAKIPADTPFTFQMIDSRGRLLTMAQTWHQVRPGEKRVDCGGCHAHSQAPLAFETTAAARQLPVDLTRTPASDIEFVRDIRPLLQQKCVSCHKGGNPPAGLAFDLQANVRGVPPDQNDPMPQDYAVLGRNAVAAHGGYKPVKTAYVFPNASRYVRKFQSRRSLLVWKLAGERLDGWANGQWPTETEPGNAATLPAGASVEMADLDYSDTANHSSLLTAAEQRLIVTWIDLGAPVDLGGGYWHDETRPTLTLKPMGGQLIVGAADAYSGLDAASLNVTVNDSPLTLSSLGDGRWSAPFAGVGVVVAKVKDNAGNWTELKLRFSGAGSGGAASRPPTNVPITGTQRAPRPPMNVPITGTQRDSESGTRADVLGLSPPSFIVLDDQLFDVAEDALAPPADPAARALSSATDGGIWNLRYRGWQGGVLPVEFADDIPQQRRDLFMAACNAGWGGDTHARCIERTSQFGYVRVTQLEAEPHRPSCYSAVGQSRRLTQYPLNLASRCWTPSQIHHQIGHALGFVHEQQRPDRDSYVTIETSNIEPANLHDFTRVTSLADRAGTYDFLSVMQSPANHLARDADLTTIVPRAGYASYSASLGIAATPSALDCDALRYTIDIGYRTSRVELETPIQRFNRVDFLDALERLDTYYRSASGFNKPRGLAAGRTVDFEAITSWVLDVYLGARSAGLSRESAFAQVVAAATRTPAWAEAHPMGAPLTAISIRPTVSFDRDEFLSTLQKLDMFFASPEGLQRAGGLWSNGGPDFQAIATWMFDIYLNSRFGGSSANVAWANVVKGIQATDEWRSKH